MFLFGGRDARGDIGHAPRHAEATLMNIMVEMRLRKLETALQNDKS
jgi:hypothetical protein